MRVGVCVCVCAEVVDRDATLSLLRTELLLKISDLGNWPGNSDPAEGH